MIRITLRIASGSVGEIQNVRCNNHTSILPRYSRRDPLGSTMRLAIAMSAMSRPQHAVVAVVPIDRAVQAGTTV